MSVKRTTRLNSNLKRVISEVIRTEVRNPKVSVLLTVTQVEVTADLHQAKVFISVIGTDQEKKNTLKALNSAAGFIAKNASKLVIMRHFPSLTFKLDETVDKQMRIEEVIKQIHEKASPTGDSNSN